MAVRTVPLKNNWDNGVGESIVLGVGVGRCDGVRVGLRLLVSECILPEDGDRLVISDIRERRNHREVVPLTVDEEGALCEACARTHRSKTSSGLIQLRTCNG